MIAAALLCLALVAAPARAQPEAPGKKCLAIPVDDSQAAVRTRRSATTPILFLNRCPGGATYVPGFEDSRTDTSSIVPFAGTLTEFPLDDDAWNQVVAETRDIFGAYDLIITDVDPGDQPHHEVAVCGEADQIGFNPREVAGVSPMRCRPIENSIAFVFPPTFQHRTRAIAETVAHEAGHSFGLDHEYLCDELMSYLDCEPQYFRDEAAPCGTDAPTDCQCPRQLQNTHQMLLQSFGAAPLTPPTVVITQPEDGAAVDPGFWVLADVTDIEAMANVQLRIDGLNRLAIPDPPFQFRTPTDLGTGRHYVEVRATDRTGAIGTAMISVALGQPCDRGGSCASDQACVAGRCVLGPGQPGGLGEPCDQSCADGVCVGDGGDQVCSAMCVDVGQGCPDGFSCAWVAELGLGCLRARPTPDGGCASSSPGTGWPALALLLLLLGTLRARLTSRGAGDREAR